MKADASMTQKLTCIVDFPRPGGANSSGWRPCVLATLPFLLPFQLKFHSQTFSLFIFAKTAIFVSFRFIFLFTSQQ